MMKPMLVCLFFLVSAPLSGMPARAAGDGALPDNDVLFKAAVDEMNRSMTELQLDDLPKPYFMQYNADDRITYTISAEYGGIVQTNRHHARGIGSRVRVGSFNLDNTNVGRGGAARGMLPLDDDYVAMRHTIWRLTDEDYKRAVEILTRKEAYLRDRLIEDRPDDFTPGQAVVHVEPSAEVVVDRPEWEARARALSDRFLAHPTIQDSRVGFFAGAVNEFIINSEGTRLRTADTGALIKIDAEIQAPDGMKLSDSMLYMAQTPQELPSQETILADIDAMCAQLTALADAPALEQYTGPVLFEPRAAGAMFNVLLADELCARPAPLGASGSVIEETLEKKLGLRILPRSFQIYDDPRETHFEGELLAGSYRYDDEGVPAERVSLVENGILKNLLASRTPTKKIKQSNGHARGGNSGDPEAHIGCLYIQDDNGIGAAELKEELIQAAKEEGLEFALRIASMEQSGGDRLGAPLYAYKVHVADGREELVRGLQFLPVQTRTLKRILASGSERVAYNIPSPIAASIITPAVLFEELELRKLTEEFDKPPILPAPAARESAASAVPKPN